MSVDLPESDPVVSALVGAAMFDFSARGCLWSGDTIWSPESLCCLFFVFTIDSKSREASEIVGTHNPVKNGVIRKDSRRSSHMHVRPLHSLPCPDNFNNPLNEEDS